MAQNLKKTFPRLLLKWDQEQNCRQMPWKGEKDPYRIWLSEIILQQTRVEQGMSYFEKFVKAFPTIHHIANAPEEKVFKLWEGLGYYSRCRNLIATAKLISGELKGQFPETYEAIKSLKGIGPYTAAAISSFAFNLPYAVVDGNVFRVLARVFGINKPIDTTAGKKLFTSLAQELLDKEYPGLYNQAIMDFGAVICKPASPLCGECVLRKNCVAFANGNVVRLPVKEKKISIRKRWFYYLVLQYKNEIAVRQRKEKDIWQDLFEFPMFESGSEVNKDKIAIAAEKHDILQKDNYTIVDISPLLKQQLSHQLIAGQFITVRLAKKPSHQHWIWVRKAQLNQLAFPRFINQYLQMDAPRGIYFKVKRVA